MQLTTNLYLLVHHLRFDFTTHAETTLNLGPHLAAFRRRTVIPLATLIRQRVVPPTLVVKLEAPAAVVLWQQMLARIIYHLGATPRLLWNGIRKF